MIYVFTVTGIVAIHFPIIAMNFPINFPTSESWTVVTEFTQHILCIDHAIVLYHPVPPVLCPRMYLLLSFDLKYALVRTCCSMFGTNPILNENCLFFGIACFRHTIHILTKIFWYTNYNILICHVYVAYILYIYWLKYFDVPTIISWYVMYMLCIYYTYTDICFVRDMTQPQASTLCSWSSNNSACLDRQPIWRDSILLLSMCGHYNRSDKDPFRSTWFSSAPLRNVAWRQLESFLDGNATSTIPQKYSSRQRDAFECCCADGAGPTTRRGCHVYEINTWLWNFGRPQPRVGGLSVAKTEKIRRKSRSEASKRGWATKRARNWPSYGIYLKYTWYIPGISLVYPVRQ